MHQHASEFVYFSENKWFCENKIAVYGSRPFLIDNRNAI